MQECLNFDTEKWLNDFLDNKATEEFNKRVALSKEQDIKDCLEMFDFSFLDNQGSSILVKIKPTNNH